MNLQSITDQVIQTAKEAGQFIREERENFDSKQVEIKALNDLVSYVDKNAEKMIVEQLQQILPEAGFIVEENTKSNRAEYNWIVDPLDGTTNFVHGIPCYCVSIALEKQGQIIIGVVYEVSRDECFYANSESASYLNGKEISVSHNKSLASSLIATGFPINNFKFIDAHLSCVSYFIQNTHGIRRIGSAAADLCYLACGRLDAFFEYNLKPWDVAAGSLIAQRSGALVCDFEEQGNYLFGEEIMAANPTLSKEFFRVIHTNFTKKES